MRLLRTLWHSRAGAWLLPIALLGCITPTAESELLERVQKERACTADKLKVTYLGASAYRVEGCGPPETFICISYQGWVCTKEGGAQSSKRVLETVTTLAARALAEVPAPPPPVQVIDPPVPIPYIPPPPPPPTF
jgi:hypothetical protein